MADLSANEKTLAQKIALALFTLLAFLGVTAITDVLDEIVAVAKTFDPTIKPQIKDVGDTLLDALATGGNEIKDTTVQTQFQKWIGIIHGAWDAIEGGTGPIVAFFDGLIQGHKAKKLAEEAQATKVGA